MTTVTTDLAGFLLARIEEDEAAAKAATPGPWRYNPGKQWFQDLDKLRAARAGIPQSGGEEFVAAGPDDGDNTTMIGVAATGAADNPQSMRDANHIARWDPARVLAECEAKRAIVAWCGEHARIQVHHLGGVVGAARESDFVPGGLTRPADSVVLRLLALPYVDHPDYRDEWRP